MKRVAELLAEMVEAKVISDYAVFGAVGREAQEIAGHEGCRVISAQKHTAPPDADCKLSAGRS